MDISRSAKRLLLIIAISIIAILVSKSLLSKAVKNLNAEAQKKQAIADKQKLTTPEPSSDLTTPSLITPQARSGIAAESSPTAAESPNPAN